MVHAQGVSTEECTKPVDGAGKGIEVQHMSLSHDGYIPRQVLNSVLDLHSLDFGLCMLHSMTHYRPEMLFLLSWVKYVCRNLADDASGLQPCSPATCIRRATF